MKRPWLILVLLMGVLPLSAQPGKKPSAEKAPTQAEMQQMMKELENMSPEEKRMMQEMGLKLPALDSLRKQAGSVSNMQLQEAFDEENQIVPKPDAARIALAKKKLTDASVAGYVAAIEKGIAAVFSADVTGMGSKSFDYIQSVSNNSREAGNMAIAFWLAGQPALCLHVLGKICAADPSNTDNLSNYAAILTMMDGQHLSIPLLDYLNMKFPQNSTILNNLGQAWLGLGDMARAEKYFDSVLYIFPAHPQANYSKSLVEEKKGNVPRAVEAMKKSIAGSYSDEKEERLKKLGYKIKAGDLMYPFKPDPDPLGLGNIIRPAYPLSVAQATSLKPYWESFTQQCRDKLQRLQKQAKEARERYALKLSQLNQRGTTAIKGATYLTGLGSLPVHLRKASLQLQAMEGAYKARFQELTRKQLETNNFLRNLQSTRKKAKPEDPCHIHRKLEDAFILAYYERKRIIDEESLALYRKYFSEQAFWLQFTCVDRDQFEASLTEIKLAWQSVLNNHNLVLGSHPEYPDCTDPEAGKPGKLADFDDVACKYNDTLDLKVIEFYQNCSRMTSKLDLKFVEYTRYDNFERPEGDTYVRSTIKFSAEKGVDKLKINKGPLKLEAKIGGSITIEMCRTGISDIILSAEAKVGAGHNTYDKGMEENGTIAGSDVIETSVEVGVEGSISIISGAATITPTRGLEKVNTGVRFARPVQ